MSAFPSILAAAQEIVSPEWARACARALAALLGPWSTREIALGVTWNSLLTALIVLTIVLVADAALRWLVRRRIRSDRVLADRASAQERERYHWFGRGLRAAVPPLTLLIWIVGAALALSVVLLDLGDRGIARTALAAVEFAEGMGLLAALFWLAWRLGGIVDRCCAALSESAESAWNRVLLPATGRSARVLLPLAVLIGGLSWLPEASASAGNCVSLLLIGGGAVILLQATWAAEQFILAYFGAEGGDLFQERRIRTQVTVLRKIAVVVIAVFTVASMLMVFDSVRQFGTSILASAGVVGIIIGFAAQKSIATLLAGVQIALTRPIRIDDVVIVENEWGRIEDITLTFVIVCIWDQRRLILPITYFMERPFQNWTSTSSDILGTVFLHVDYTMPVQALREELDRILERSKFWDGKLCSVLVTDTKEHTLVVRAMASAADGDQAWFLRCEMREKLVEFIQNHYPQCLPRLRAELQGAAPIGTSLGAGAGFRESPGRSTAASGRTPTS